MFHKTSPVDGTEKNGKTYTNEDSRKTHNDRRGKCKNTLDLGPRGYRLRPHLETLSKDNTAKSVLEKSNKVAAPTGRSVGEDCENASEKGSHHSMSREKETPDSAMVYPDDATPASNTGSSTGPEETDAHKDKTGLTSTVR